MWGLYVKILEVLLFPLTLNHHKSTLSSEIVSGCYGRPQNINIAQTHHNVTVGVIACLCFVEPPGGGLFHMHAVRAVYKNGNSYDFAGKLFHLVGISK
jgi:hypothetical protein